MLNTFHYAENIPPLVRDRLIDREPLCQKAVFENSPLFWTLDTDPKGRALYTLTKRGLVNLRLVTFSENEVMDLSDDEFRNRVFIQDVEDQRRREKEYIEQRLADWTARLNHLFNLIATWVPTDFQVLRSDIVQRDEDLMRRYEITPGRVPILTLLRGTSRISFVPSALWIIGADGRVNVTTNQGQYTLVDRRETADLPSEWVIALDDRNRTLRRFDESSFTELLRRHA